jgi:hypothetical protein
MNRPCTYTLDIFRSSPQNKNLSNIPSRMSCGFFAKPVSPKPPQRAGLPVSSLTLTMRASNDFPAANEPTWRSRQHSCAPPKVARYSRVATDNCWSVNDTACTDVGGLGVGLKPFTLDAMLACWRAVRIEGEKPPETSVPRPTCAIIYD